MPLIIFDIFLTYPKSPKSPCRENPHHQQMSAFQLDLGQWPPEGTKLERSLAKHGQAAWSLPVTVAQTIYCQDRATSLKGWQTATNLKLQEGKENWSTKLFTNFACMCIYIYIYIYTYWYSNRPPNVTGLVTSAGLHRVCFQLLHSFTQILARVIFGASHLQDISLDHIISHHITSR